MLHELYPSTALPQFEPTFLAGKSREIVDRLALDLSGRRVITEAATGAYVVTPVIAALAGAEVTALTKETRHGTLEDVVAQTRALAACCDVEPHIDIVESLQETHIESADIVTNCGHLRPLDANFIARMRPGAVIPLMYESWEFRVGDIDLDACRSRGIRVAGTNERHAALRVFDYLGMLAAKGLLDCHVPVVGSRLILVCDNPFGKYIERALRQCGAELVANVRGPQDSAAIPATYDAVVLADTPSGQPSIGLYGEAKYPAERLGRFRALVQLWGDVDRGALPGVVFSPATAPRNGHMGILLSDIGPDPIVRLQAGGLKVGELLCRVKHANESPFEGIIDKVLVESKAVTL